MATPTKKQIAAGQRRSLKAMRSKLLDMANAWEDVDQYNGNILTEAAEKLLDVHAELLEAAEDE
ncbi:MAG TPA: hypothetical protein PK873_14405 [Pseudomonas sp.]|uniref:hypothetical protein n=1 Tax=Pseudomonas sp. TaxID=306 RepID=UPI002C8DF15E|nr:hypothetical protein [Pseudomonas sp.]HRL94741.1 hypothetical protein [Pseudomonas sp.]